MKSPPDRYSMVAIILHWTIAALILTNVGIAWAADEVRGPDRVAALQPHKVIGITVLLLTLARLAWRLVMKPPRMPDTMAPWERVLARTVHVLFYVVMVALPLSGWAMVSASPLAGAYPIHLGPFEWPMIQPLADLPRQERRDVQEFLEEAHELLAQSIIYVLVPLHVAGALKHQFIDRGDELGRMIPFWPRRRAEGHAE
ncbi:MAG TPA: cytochrome b [Caulobacteraceae bacterium]